MLRTMAIMNYLYGYSRGLGVNLSLYLSLNDCLRLIAGNTRAVRPGAVGISFRPGGRDQAARTAGDDMLARVSGLG